MWLITFIYLILTLNTQALISANNMKPVVKLLINRHNNKYSYTGASDDNLLKNIELFDKLSLRFSNRVLFIKDVIGRVMYRLFYILCSLGICYIGSI